MKKILLFLSLCICGISQATTYYISPGGNDASGTGTVGNPWKTLYKATSTVTTAGDIIHVNAGTYVETIQCNLNVGVSIEGDGVTSIIKSTLTTPYFALLRCASVVGTNGNQHVSNLKFDGQMATTWGFDIEGRSNFSIHDCTIVDFFDRGVIWAGGEGFADGAPSVYATGNSFYNNIMHNCADYDVYGRGCLNFGGQDGMLIYNNTITQTQRPQGQNGWPIKAASGGFIKGCKIYNNILTKIPMGGDAGFYGWDFCIELFNEVGGNEIYNNTIQGSIDMNYQSKGAYAYSMYIHDNTIMQPVLNTWRENGIIFEFSTPDAIVSNNHFKNITYGIVFNTRALDQVTNVTIKNNLFENIGQNLGTSGNAGAAIATYSEGTDDYIVNNMHIYNNTAIAAAGNAPGNGIRFNGAAAVLNTKINNNVFQGFYEAWLIGYPSNVINTIAMQNNCLYLNGNNNDPYYYIGIPANVTSTGNIKSNPNLDVSFHPTGTPLVDAGIYVGLPYSGTAPDRGFFEITGALPVTLLDFAVTENKGKNLLQWKTATEVNSNYFTVERSSNGTDYSAIGTVQASGFSTTEANYNFTDASPLDGVNYYRLIITDKDNSSAYSKVISISVKKNQSLNIVTAQLSSGKNNVTLTVSTAQTQKANLVLFDRQGRSVLNETILLQKGINTIDKKTPALSRGIYYIKLITADETAVKNVLTAE